jgi:site-specific recombinase XerD
VPRVSVPQNANVPAVWTDSDINKLLSSVDRSTAVGKRDYAVLLMIVELGLRSCDVNQLKLANLNWQQKEIEVSQSKTGVMNVCPMSDELGWAVIDYIRDGRQKSDLPYLFLTAHAPYTGFGASTAKHILERYIKRSGISAKPMGVSRGTHSLRHSFARKLLSQDIPLDLISEIMGHTALNSASPYLKVDIEGLRECALSIGEVDKYAGQAIL